MAMAPGTASRLALGDATTSMTLIAFQSESLQESRGLLDGNGIAGTRAHYTERVQVGQVSNGGNISWYPQTNELAYILPKCHGANASGTSYPLGETPASFIALKELNSSYVDNYPALYVDNYTLTGEYGERVMISIDCLGTGEVTNQSGFPSGSSITFNTANDLFTFNQAALVIAGTTYEMRNFALTINNAIELRQSNSRTATAAAATNRIVNFATTLFHGDSTAALYAALKDGDVTASLTLTNNAQSLAYTFSAWRPLWHTATVPGREEIVYPIEGPVCRTSAAAEFTCTLDSTP